MAFVNEWVSKEDIEKYARFIADVVGQLDLSTILKAYKGQGGSLAYHPEVLLSLSSFTDTRLEHSPLEK